MEQGCEKTLLSDTGFRCITTTTVLSAFEKYTSLTTIYILKVNWQRLITILFNSSSVLNYIDKKM